MLLAVVVSAIGCAADDGIRLTGLDTVHLDSRDVEVRDILDPCSMDGLSETVLTRLIARLPAGSRSVDLSREAVANLLQRSVPGLAGNILYRHETAGDIHIEWPGPKPVRSSGFACYATEIPVAAGEGLTLEHVVETDCSEAERVAPVIYDRQTGVVRAEVGLSENDYLGRIFLPDGDYADAGDAMLLVARIGSVTIERNVHAIQPSLGESRVFVEDEDGRIFSVAVDTSQREGH